MRTRIIIQLATLLVLLLGTSTKGLFFSYPKNALIDFFHSLHHKKEVKKPQNIHHYHLHYYPVRTQVWAKPIKAPEKLELDKLHSNHLEAFGWNDHEYSIVPEPIVYRSSPPRDLWPDSSLTRPWEEEIPEHPIQSLEIKTEVPKSGIIVQVPLHQNIIVQQPAPKEETHPLVSFVQKLRRIKNAIFSDKHDSDESDSRKSKSIIDDKLKAYMFYFKPEGGRKL